MFYYVKGELTAREANVCVVECGGVGYKLTVSLITSEAMANKMSEVVKLFTFLSVREDGVELFGFGTAEERTAFNLLTSVSGVGPKAAMNILSIMPPDRLAMAICTEDIKAISKAQNIGSKTAARIVLELKDKIAKESSVGLTVEKPSQAPLPTRGNISEAAEALMALGYDKHTVTSALSGIEPSRDVGEIIKTALKKLSR